MTTPRPVHTAALAEAINAALHESVDRDRPAEQRTADTAVAEQAALAVLTSSDPAVQAALAASLPASALVAELLERDLLTATVRTRADGWASMTIDQAGQVVTGGRAATREVTWSLPQVLLDADSAGDLDTAAAYALVRRLQELAPAGEES